MTESKHTPGPWKVGTSFDGDRLPCVDWTNPKTHVLFELAKVWGTVDSTIENDECRANARLMAAAPDLLEAVKEALGFYVSDYEGRDGKDLSGGAADRARAAIAKATGERHG